MPGPWERIDVSSWECASDETEGSEVKVWLYEPGSGTRWLYKDTVIPKNQLEQGEDWSEVIATSVANLLGIPCATTRLALRNGRRGSLSKDVAPPGYRVSEGWLVLQGKGAPGYFPTHDRAPGIDPTHPDVHRPGHNLQNIRQALHDVLPPPGFNGPSNLTAFDVFTGYLILDSLIANVYRHEQNWALLCPEFGDGPELLSPSYDHASCLWYSLPDEKRRVRIRDPKAFQSWVERGTAHRFEHQGNKPPSLVVLAGQAMELGTSPGRHYRPHRVSKLDLEPLTATVLRSRDDGMNALIPEMSGPAVTFARMVLETNLRRLRDDFDGCTDAHQH